MASTSALLGPFQSRRPTQPLLLFLGLVSPPGLRPSACHVLLYRAYNDPTCGTGRCRSPLGVATRSAQCQKCVSVRKVRPRFPLPGYIMYRGFSPKVRPRFLLTDAMYRESESSTQISPARRHVPRVQSESSTQISPGRLGASAGRVQSEGSNQISLARQGRSRICDILPLPTWVAKIRIEC